MSAKEDKSRFCLWRIRQTPLKIGEYSICHPSVIMELSNTLLETFSTEVKIFRAHSRYSQI